ncbi:bifunctional ADP-dependent NAD(P)H-hydrate dehydratase/NAD(P)H-hydrate epimerase [Promicromonospora thailandica]|uniref:Multifunctional fusion protein n=1 Tax=Promicromonospora thailandica TaxID=765201 RepID=A0A9X2JUS6_9MICO|nr:bifunctional ADP-dependent NAD(P)H-hydrate dehydratase/NAD(P)H-hydrate epimerase [Promicromonospora thailandica]MCP2264810.1 yjeF C-terminal region, hydroxyethylthiazole kinase-related/yjeF N-terminal region [Promicromonospora thailandica]BFF18940.1 NAD(P)H-hydrate epimerase [Promicromonospora thailandica]
MKDAWSSDEIRKAEEPLIAAGEPLMARAAYGLAQVVLREVALRRAEGRAGTADGARQGRARLRGSLGSDGLPGQARVRPGRVVGRRTADAGAPGGRGDVRGAHAVLLVGPGNNGGDTLFAGAHLVRRGMTVTAVLASARAHEAGLAAFRAAGGRAASLADVRVPAVVELALGADVILDGLVGVGARGALRPPAGGLVRALADARDAAADRWPYTVAVDIPSGIGVDDGAVPGPVLRADRTVTFGALKPGLLLPPAAQTAGEVELVDVGFPASPASGAARRNGVARHAWGTTDPAAGRVLRLEPADVAALWPAPGARDHKYTRGAVGVVAGTSTYPGAAVLAASGAVLSGAGMVRYLGPEVVGTRVLLARPEVVVAGGRVQSWVLGPGVPALDPDDEGPDDDGQARRIFGALAAVTGVLSEDVTGGRMPAVVDAGALTMLEHRLPPSVVLTPHAGELAELLRGLGHEVDRTAVEARPLHWARTAHQATGGTILLKGAVTVVAGPGDVYAQADAPAWTATAGAGDVLAGILGTLLAGRSRAVVEDETLAARLAAAAVLVHGRAAARASAGGPVAALEIARAVPAVVAELLAGADPA